MSTDEAQKSRYVLSLVGEFSPHICQIKDGLMVMLKDQTMKS